MHARTLQPQLLPALTPLLPRCTRTPLRRDLAEQTHKCFQAYARHLSCPPVASVLLVGGLDAGQQLCALQAGAEIVVSTPGRVMNFAESGKLPLDKARASSLLLCARRAPACACVSLHGCLSAF